MYGAIAEDPSDVETLLVLIRRLSNISSIPIKGKGYGGCGEMLTKGAKQLRLFADLGCKRFIICYDADGPNGADRRQDIIDKIITPSGISLRSCCPLVPVQEIEAWILADIHQAVPKIISSWQPSEVAKPESITSPKEHLERLSRGSNKKPRYSYTVHNPRVAEHLDLSTVHKKCPSFRRMHKFVAGYRPIGLPADGFPGAGQRSLWAFTDSKGGSEYSDTQCAAPSDWGSVVTLVQNLDVPPEQLTRLCEYGWAELEPLNAELEVVLESKPNANIRRVLSNLRKIVEDRHERRWIALDDGTR